MATVSKSVGEYSGEDDEDIQEWVDSVEVIAQLTGLAERDVIRIVVLALRKRAKSWGMALIRNDKNVNWVVLKSGLIARFSNHKKADETLARFLSTPEAESYDGYVQLLKDARVVKETRGVSIEHVMRQIIARSPAGLKSLLLQLAQSSVKWEEFLQHTENSAWVAFPEKIIGRVEQQVEVESEVRKIGVSKSIKGRLKSSNDKHYDKKSWYCHFHGEGDHSTKFCKVVQKLEAKGWKRGSMEKNVRAIEEEKDLLNDLHYSSSIKNTEKNPFFIEGEINGKNIPLIIDTGADVSIINKNLLAKSGCKEYAKTSTKLKSACGGEIKVEGEVKNLKIKILNNEIQTDTIVTSSEPQGYGIIGANAIMSNKKALCNVISSRIFHTSAGKKEQNWIRNISIDSILSKYEQIFTTEINQMNKCKFGKHIILTDGQPIAQKKIQIPKLWEGEIDSEINKLLSCGIIRPSKSPWASRVIPVRKKMEK
ncbi:MAG: retroviral-like aspartic protease family protein [Culicoidibacterales bacterium]